MCNKRERSILQIRDEVNRGGNEDEASAPPAGEAEGGGTAVGAVMLGTPAVVAAAVGVGVGVLVVGGVRVGVLVGVFMRCCNFLSALVVTRSKGIRSGVRCDAVVIIQPAVNTCVARGGNGRDRGDLSCPPGVRRGDCAVGVFCKELWPVADRFSWELRNAGEMCF